MNTRVRGELCTLSYNACVSSAVHRSFGVDGWQIYAVVRSSVSLVHRAQNQNPAHNSQAEPVRNNIPITTAPTPWNWANL